MKATSATVSSFSQQRPVQTMNIFKKMLHRWQIQNIRYISMHVRTKSEIVDPV